jgi:1,4-dihydroxy-2-naphthoate octaprenyltransferase
MGDSILSEEAKLVYIQMRMKEIKRMEHVSYEGLWVGVLLTFIGFVFAGLGFLTTNGFWFWLGVVGIIIAAGEFYSYALNSYQYFKLKQELKTMTEASPSP